MEDVRLIVFPDDDIVGHHPNMVALQHGYSYVDVGGEDVQSCVTRSFMDDYDEINTGEGSYLVSATLRCLGLGVRPGGSVVLVRSGAADQASLVFHQGDDARPIPPDGVETAVVPGWPGPAWVDSPHIISFPDPSPPTEWPVNVALRTIGVRREGSPDEATAIGLRLPPSATGG